MTSRVLFGTVNSLTEWYRPDRGLTADDLADVVVRTAFDGLRRRREEPPSGKLDG